jgi:PAS domain S-box-containing protein
MTQRNETPAAASSQTRLSRVADACALLTVAIGLLVITGWLLEIDPLKRVLPNLDLAARFAAQWRNLRTLTTELLNGEGQLDPEESTRLVALRMGLVNLLRDEIRADAVETFEAHKATTLRDLHRTGDTPLLLLVVSVLLALVTSGAVAWDVSKQEQTVRRQREWLRVTLSSIGDAVIACDTEGTVTFLNPIAEWLTGWKTEEAIGQPMMTAFHFINEQTREPAADIAAQVLRDRRVVALASRSCRRTRRWTAAGAAWASGWHW